MSKYVKQYNLLPGDRIITPKSDFNIVLHHAIYIGYDQYNTHYIAENNNTVGVRLIKVDDFFRNYSGATRIEKLTGSWQQREKVVMDALMRLGQPYDLLNYNCEHFANEIQTGRKVSPQVKNAGIGAAVLGVLALLFLAGSKSR